MAKGHQHFPEQAEGPEIRLNSRNTRSQEKDWVGMGMLLLLVLITFSLLVAFFWVLFFSPTGQSRTIRVDFNESSDAADFARPQSARIELRIAFASMISPEDIYDVYGDLVEYLGDKVQRKPRVIQRTTYREINDLLVAGETDLGFIGTGSYLRLAGTGKVDALVVPVVNGKSYCHAYVIVSRKSPIQSLADLQGRVFAFMDPDSLTGFSYPNALFHQRKEGTKAFLGGTISTHSHADSIHAVFHKLADGASVSSYVYDYYQHWSPEKTKECRILEVSDPIGMPPVVVPHELSAPLKTQIKSILLEMHEDAVGKEVLRKMNIDAFVPAEGLEEIYERTQRWVWPEVKTVHAVR